MKLLVSLLALFAGNAIATDELPSLELGAGLLAVSLPDYRGARRSSTKVAPIPFIRYRGEHVRIDDGARGIFYESENLSISLSTNLSIVGEDDTPERQDMDDIESVVEIGPLISYRFHRLEHSGFWLDLPYRVAYTLDKDFDHVGEVFQPRISWRKPELKLGDWKMRASLGPLFASRDYHSYYYSVSEVDATPERPAYDAQGGYSGYRGEFTFSKRFGSFWLGGFLRYDDLDDSKIDDSPLVSKTDYWMGGVAVAWVFYDRY